VNPSPSEYRPMFDGRRVTCPCCGGSGNVQECPDDSIPGAGTVTDICGLCKEAGTVRPAVARRYLLDISDYDGLDKVTSVVDAWYAQRQAERDKALPVDTARRRGENRMYR